MIHEASKEETHNDSGIFNSEVNYSIQNDSQFIKDEQDIHMEKGKGPEVIETGSPHSDKKDTSKEELKPVHLDGI